ncbi:MAG: patatin family protein [Anaerorhabdus sp.]|uniref:patatin-like phospholipase family protein n=1 Tax=Anaerorhabdus sp. TaxID=1872524 RepID=UPI003A87B140
MEKVGLILEGGGMRGVFTTGVLDCFLDNGIEFDEIIGVSAGACHACSYISKQKKRARDICVNYIDDKRYCSVYSLITTGDMFGVQFAYHEIPDVLYPFDHETYNSSNTKLYSTVTNVETGEAEYHLLKDMKEDIDDLRASASLPFVSRIVDIKGNKYLDGGIVDSIPLKKIETDGCTKNIVVLTQPKEYRKTENKIAWLAKILYRKYPKMYDLLKKRHLAYNEEIAYVDEQEAKGNILVIRPEKSLDVSRIEKDKNKLEVIYQLGYEVTKNQVAEIIKFIKK